MHEIFWIFIGLLIGSFFPEYLVRLKTWVIMIKNKIVDYVKGQ